jgi:hypothetical protein
VSRDFIPIADAKDCAAPFQLPVHAPRLHGDAQRLAVLLTGLDSVLAGPGGPLHGLAREAGAWLRSFRLEDDTAEVGLSHELGCRSEVVAAIVFDELRQKLRDTDIYVQVEAPR